MNYCKDMDTVGKTPAGTKPHSFHHLLSARNHVQQQARISCEWKSKQGE